MELYALSGKSETFLNKYIFSIFVNNIIVNLQRCIETGRSQHADVTNTVDY